MSKRKETPKHITFGELHENMQFQALSSDKKHMIYTIKMIAYRAETAMVQLVKPNMTEWQDARSLM
jgi:hypothetical protein